MDTLGSLKWAKSPIAVVFLVSGKIINGAIICSASASILTFRDASSVKIDTVFPLLWCT